MKRNGKRFLGSRPKTCHNSEDYALTPTDNETFPDWTNLLFFQGHKNETTACVE